MSKKNIFSWVVGVVAAVAAPGVLAQSTVNSGDVADKIEEVVVTGSFIYRPSQTDTTSPIDVVGNEDIDDIGAFVPSDIVATLTTNNGAQNQSDGFNQTFSAGTTNVNLRGLGVSSTLTLMNGRRQTLSAASTLTGDQFVDLNSLVPTIAIERIEILGDGASSLYGSDAVAGVVNVITHRDFEGLRFSGNYGTTTSDSQDDLQLSVLAGTNVNDNLALVGAASYFTRSDLSAEARRNEFEDRASLSTFGQPGTYLIFPQNGPPTRTVDPSCQALADSDNDVVLGIDGRGPTCQFDFGDYFPLVSEETRLQLYGSAELAINDRLDYFAEATYSNNEVDNTLSPSQPILFPPFIPDHNPGAAALGIPAGGRALAFIRPEGARGVPSPQSFDYETYRIASGFRGEIGSGWSFETAVTYSENAFDFLNLSDIKVDRFLAAIDGAGGPNNDQYFNPVFGASNDPAVREDFRGVYGWDAEASLLTLDGHITGTLFELPAGPVGVALGAQFRRDKLSYDYSADADQDNLSFFIGNTDFSGDQEVYAVFGEADVPITDSLSLTAALRYEDFGDTDTLDPKVGLLWAATEDLSLRTTWGTSFRAPSIFQVAGQFRVPALIFDPIAGSLGTIAQLTQGAPNAALESQNSDTFNFGITWDKVELGLSVSLDYWSFKYSDFITPENAAAIVNANAATGNFADQLERDPTTGDLLSVTTFYRNAGNLETDGLDLSLSKDWNTVGAGQYRLQLEMTRILSYDLQDPILGAIDGAGQRNFTNFGVPTPESRASLGLLWTLGVRHSANAFVRHISDYRDDNSQNATIESNTLLDVQYTYLTPAFGNSKEGTLISVGVKNLFDKMPPDVVSRAGYDSLTHDPLGRRVYMSIKQNF